MSRGIGTEIVSIQIIYYVFFILKSPTNNDTVGSQIHLYSISSSHPSTTVTKRDDPHNYKYESQRLISKQNFQHMMRSGNVPSRHRRRPFWVVPLLAMLTTLHVQLSILMPYPRNMAEDTALDIGPPFITNSSSFDFLEEKQKMGDPPMFLVSDIKTHAAGCWRRCPRTRKNHIVVNFNRRAGLNDRFYIIERMTNIAGYLCANLHIPSPNTWLAPSHNRGESLSMNVAWSDYQKRTWVMPDVIGKTAINTLYKLPNSTDAIVASTNIRTSPLYNLKGLLAHNVLPQRRTWYSTMEIPSVPLYHFVAHPSNGIEQLLRLDDIVNDQWRQIGNGVNESDIGSFLWEIPVDPYHLLMFENEIRVAMAKRNQTIPPSFPDMLPKRVPGCQYVSTLYSDQVERVVRSVWEDVHDPSSTMGFLHIRRGDATAQCNTTIPDMHSYLKCSFANTTKYGNITMLVATDETDPDYLAKVTASLHGLYPHVRMVHLDPIVEQHAKKFANEIRTADNQAEFANNFFTFQVENVIRYQRAAFVLSQRRSECNVCNILSSWDRVKWVGLSRT